MPRPKKRGRPNGSGAGKKRCPKCLRFFPLEKIREHILSHDVHELAREVPASHTQVEAFEEELDSLNGENKDLSEKYAELAKTHARVSRKEEVYRAALSDMLSHMRSIVDLEREF